jgi:hypothetical protein
VVLKILADRQVDEKRNADVLHAAVSKAQGDG